VVERVETDTLVSLQPLVTSEKEANTSLFVHYCSGRIAEVTRAASLHVSSANVEIERDDGEIILIPRGDVYFVSGNSICPFSMY
jgi:hypothetical protein